MASNRLKKKAKQKKEPKPVQAQAQPSPKIHEIFGILTLASALLVGPSLASAQFGEGTLMGPFGQMVGTLLNQALGLAGHLVVLVLLVAALRIFAGGIGSKEAPPLIRLWSERLGSTFALLSVAVLLHLAVRPHRIHGASAGGFVGELGAEILCAVVSTPGAWVVSLTVLALALVLSTRLSWARTGYGAWRLLLFLGGRGRAALGRGRSRLNALRASLGQLFRRREMEALPTADGVAALPPVVRLEGWGGGPPVILPQREPDAEQEAEVAPLPMDLEINPEPEPEPEPEPPHIPCLDPSPEDLDLDQPDESAPEPRSAAPAKNKTKNKDKDKKKTRAVDGVEQVEAVEQVEQPEQPEQPEQSLTIVEPTYREQSNASGEEAVGEKRVEQTDGPGFVLHGEVYKAPPLSLLECEHREETAIDRDAIYRQADRLVKTLADYKILGRVTEVHPGPVVTMYEFVPAPGTRISKVANLANDLAMSLAAQRVRIVAPIPGKGAIGIEVPNDQRDTVYFKEIVAHDAFRKSKSNLTLALGKNIFGAPVTVDLAKMPHLLVAGATGAGKSVSINAMISSLLLKSSPEEVRLILVDPKYLELSGYNDIPHLLLPVVTDPAKANIALRWAVREMERRYQLLADMQVRDIRSYNRKVDKLRGAAGADGEVAEDGTTISEASPSKILVVRKNADGTEEPIRTAELAAQEPATEEASAAAEAGAEPPPQRSRKKRLPRRLPYIVVVIDEFADLMMVASKDVETSVARLAQKARAAGIHVILATQRPSVDVITGLIKANFPSRVSFQVASGHDSKTILGTQGAENLLGAGDMLILDRGAEMKRIHGAFISDEEILRVIDWLKGQGRPIYDMEILQPGEEEEQAPSAEDDYDEMYDQAVALVAETRQASISMIQRRLRVGYNRAARMVERMEREGVVGPADGVKGREVLIEPR